MRRHHHNAFVPYADLLMCFLSFTVMAMAMLMLSVNPKVVGTADYHPKAEFLITLTWDDHRNVDLDLWLQDPARNIIYYDNKEASNINLDRDSLGYASNLTTLSDGHTVLSSNQEVISIRAIIPGEFIAAVNYFGGHDTESGQTYTLDDPRAPIDAKVQVQKVNPNVTEIANKDMHFTRLKESQNAICFRINDDGSAEVHECSGPNIIDRHIRSIPSGVRP